MKSPDPSGPASLLPRAPEALLVVAMVVTLHLGYFTTCTTYW